MGRFPICVFPSGFVLFLLLLEIPRFLFEMFLLKCRCFKEVSDLFFQLLSLSLSQEIPRKRSGASVWETPLSTFS